MRIREFAISASAMSFVPKVNDCGRRLGREVRGGKTEKNDGVIGDSDVAL
jgi:hypothetical protein